MGIIDDIGKWGDRLKRLYDVSQDIKNVELVESLADLRLAISDWRLKFSELQEENLELKAKLKELDEKLSLGDEVVFRDGLYYARNPVEGKPAGPFCPACHESSRTSITLTRQAPPFAVFGDFICPKCKQGFGNKGIHSEDAFND